MIRHISAVALAGVLTFSTMAQADEVEEAIAAALEAYRAGDVQYAEEELVHAQQLLQAMKAEGLSAFLPPAPDGWTRTVNTDMNTGLAMMGGGTGAEATYEGPDGSFRISMMADNALVASMAAVLSNAQLMGTMGKVVRIGRQRFLEQDNSLQTLVGNRVLIQAQDAAPAVMMPVLEKIDFAALEKFGS